MPKEIRLINLSREISWYFALIAGFACILFQIYVQYVPIGNPESIYELVTVITLMFILAILLTFLWWRGTSTEIKVLMKLRRFMQEHCFQFSLLFISLAMLLCFALYSRCHMIYSINMQSRYNLSCIFVLPLIYSAMMYALPPKHIARVIVPGWNIAYVIIRVLLSSGLTALAIRQFASNFL